MLTSGSDPLPPKRRFIAGDSVGLLGLLVVATVIVPAILFGIFAWLSYTTAFNEARSRLERTLDALYEHATRVLETHELVALHVDDLLAGLPDDQVRAREAELHRRLAALKGSMPQVQDIWVLDRAGRPLVTASIFPAPRALDLSDRGYFRVHAEAPRDTYISEVLQGRAMNVQFFQVSRRRIDGDGKFGGVTAVSVPPSFFQEFYRSFAPGYTMSLLRQDGVLLARQPEGADVSERLPESDTLMRSIARSPDAGWFQSVSAMDGTERLLAYRRLRNYPLYVTAGQNMADIRAGWLRFLGSHLMFSAPATAGLFVISLLALAQARRERKAVRRLQEEVDLRKLAEAQLLQSQKMEAVGRLTGGIAHDFNNLLTVIMGNLETIARHLPQTNERLKRAVGNAREGAERAASLTHRLLAFSRRQPLEEKPIELNALVAGMADLLRRTIGETIAIESRLGAALGTIRADVHQVENALLNLVINARDAMPDGGRLIIETTNLDVDEGNRGANQSSLPAGQYVTLCVADTGTGMSPDVRDMAFEPFFTTKPAGRGTGLGLSMVYGFMKQSGGHVRIDSEPGRGTRVTLYFPRAAQAEAVQPVPTNMEQPPAEPRGNGQTILVCEDDEGVRSFSAETLSGLGYAVVEAGTMPEALALLDRHPDVELLFTDVVLPGDGNGRMLADEACQRRPGLKVLFTSGYTRDAIVKDGRLDEGVELLNKPFSSGDLAQRIGRLFSRS